MREAVNQQEAEARRREQEQQGMDLMLAEIDDGPLPDIERFMRMEEIDLLI